MEKPLRSVEGFQLKQWRKVQANAQGAWVKLSLIKVDLARLIFPMSSSFWKVENTSVSSLVEAMSLTRLLLS